MNATLSSLRGLYWKETRQIIPLILILLGVALLFFLADAIWRDRFRGVRIPLVRGDRLRGEG